MTKPMRVQLHRTKGWRMPANTVKVERSSRFGNPFDHIAIGRPAAVDFYRRWLREDLTEAERKEIQRMITWEEMEAMRHKILSSISLLKGKNLACWCPLDQPCHADVLLGLAAR